MITPINLRQKPGSGGWNKRDEWDFRDLVSLGKSELMRVAKKYKKVAGSKLDPKDKIYLFWLNACLALVIKSMPVVKSKEPEEDIPMELPVVRLYADDAGRN